MLYCEQFYKETSIHHYSILIVEDSEVFSKTLFKSLSQNTNYTIQQAYNFEEASEKLTKKYDFIILDLHLPDSYGEELIDSIKKLSQAKIIVLTSESDIQVRETLFKKGIVDYLIKDKYFSVSMKAISHTIESLERNKANKILVIEDSLFMAKQLQKTLELRNYQVQIARTAKEGMNLLKKSNINTIILDMELPDKHGLDLLREIKDINELCHIPVIIVSSTNDPEIIRSSLKLGASDFIKKPFNIEEFVLKVDI
ncbi:response regulator, partial [Sulfurimonas sp. SAG-AH-194-I05]